MKRLSAREQKRKDDLAKAAESIRNMNRMRDMGVRPSRLPADDDYEGANGDAMREEALEMMNRGSLAVEMSKTPVFGRRHGGSVGKVYDEEDGPPQMRRPAGGLRDRSGKIRKGYMVR